MAAIAFALLICGLVVPVATAPSAFAASPISGGGSGFAALELDQWRADTARAPFNLTVNYVAQGSSFGRQQFTDGNLDFGASDIIFQDEEIPNLQSGRCAGKPLASCFVYVPVSAGGLSLMYNLVDAGGHRVNNLQLTRAAACGIFTGAIKKWNDPAITVTNPSLAGFDQDIIPVIRSDGAGESYVLSEFCIAVASDVWNAFIAERIAHDPSGLSTQFRNGQPVSSWPQNWGKASPQLAADGVANVVADPVAGQNAITYVAAGYAKVRNFPVASLQNAAGVYTQPDEDNVTVALGYATGRGDGTFILNFNGPDQRAYFPSTYSYVLAQTTGWDPGKGATLGQFLCYAVSKGQVIAPQLRYARLSAPLVNIAIGAISKIPGAPPATSCFLAGAPPPPGAPQVAGGPGGSLGGAGAGPNGAAGAGPGVTTTVRGGSAGGGANGVNCVSAGLTTTTAGASTTTTSGRAATTTTHGGSASATTTAGASTTTAAAGASGSTTTVPRSTTSTTVDCASAQGTGVADLQTQLAAAAGSHDSSGGGSTTTTLLFGVLLGACVSGVISLRKRLL